MCGIVCVAYREPEPELIWTFTYALALAQERGRDATGVAWVGPRGQVRVLKAPVEAVRLVASERYREFLGKLSDGPGILLGHTRLATQGSPQRPSNNHPHRAGRIVGVHNGMVWNYSEKAVLWPLQGECDSELLFHLLDRRLPAERLPTGEDVAHALRPVQGIHALAWVDVERPEWLHLVRQENPVEVAMVRGRAVFAASRLEYIREGQLLARAGRGGRRYRLERIGMAPDHYLRARADGLWYLESCRLPRGRPIVVLRGFEAQGTPTEPFIGGWEACGPGEAEGRSGGPA